MTRNKRSRTETAGDLCDYCFAFVRKARRQGCANMFDTDLVWGLAGEYRISPDDFSMTTVKRIARARAKDMNETHLLDL